MRKHKSYGIPALAQRVFAPRLDRDRLGRWYSAIPFAVRSQSFPFYLLRYYKNPVLRAATLRELNEDCGSLRLGPYKDRARAIIWTRREAKLVRSLGALFTVGRCGQKTFKFVRRLHNNDMFRERHECVIGKQILL